MLGTVEANVHWIVVPSTFPFTEFTFSYREKTYGEKAVSIQWDITVKIYLASKGWYLRSSFNEGTCGILCILTEISLFYRCILHSPEKKLWVHFFCFSENFVLMRFPIPQEASTVQVKFNCCCLCKPTSTFIMTLLDLLDHTCSAKHAGDSLTVIFEVEHIHITDLIDPIERRQAWPQWLNVTCRWELLAGCWSLIKSEKKYSAKQKINYLEKRKKKHFFQMNAIGFHAVELEDWKENYIELLV